MDEYNDDPWYSTLNSVAYLLVGAAEFLFYLFSSVHAIKMVRLKRRLRKPFDVQTLTLHVLLLICICECVGVVVYSFMDAGLGWIPTIVPRLLWGVTLVSQSAFSPPATTLHFPQLQSKNAF